MLTEVVWAVGQVHHDETVHLIEDLEAKLWIIYDTSPEMRKLREMVSVVYKLCRSPFPHFVTSPLG